MGGAERGAGGAPRAQINERRAVSHTSDGAQQLSERHELRFAVRERDKVVVLDGRRAYSQLRV